MKKTLLSLALLAGVSSVSNAATWDITVTNLTHGNHFTPLLLTAHAHDEHLFQVGTSASVEMAHMAECGHLAPLMGTTVVGAADMDTIANPASGPLAPGSSTTTMITTTQTHLSVVSMVLPTNDAFMGLESQHIPTEAGTYVYWVNAYDAGTEKNDEILAASDSVCAYGDGGMMPAAPGADTGKDGTGVSTADSNIMVHIHRGALGDDDASGGKSDLDNTIHRWQNPVAKIVVTVTP